MSFWNIRPSRTSMTILCIGILLLPVSLVAQQTAADDVLLARSVIGSGAVQASGSVNLVGTIGQSIIGHCQVNGTNADLGFWPGILKLPVGIGELPPALVQDLQVTVYPAPFTGLAQIEYRLECECRVLARIHDISGRLVTRLGGDGLQSSGLQSLVWDGRDAVGQSVPPGVYFIRIEARAEADKDLRVAVEPLLLIH